MRRSPLVMIGVRPDGTKESIAVEDGYRESAESWKTILRDFKHFLPLVRAGVRFVDGVQRTGKGAKRAAWFSRAVEL